MLKCGSGGCRQAMAQPPHRQSRFAGPESKTFRFSRSSLSGCTCAASVPHDPDHCRSRETFGNRTSATMSLRPEDGVYRHRECGRGNHRSGADSEGQFSVVGRYRPSIQGEVREIQVSMCFYRASGHGPHGLVAIIRLVVYSCINCRNNCHCYQYRNSRINTLVIIACVQCCMFMPVMLSARTRLIVYSLCGIVLTSGNSEE